jgi:hypothetical protein
MAAGSTYEPIATQTLASAAATITFSSIPATFTDLRLVWVMGNSSFATNRIQFNGDTASNYSDTRIYGNGASASSYRYTSATNISLEDGSAPNTPRELITVDIFSYAGSTNKTVLATISNDANGSGSVDRVVGLWRNTSAITSLLLSSAAGNFVVGTTATLYGIKAA